MTAFSQTGTKTGSDTTKADTAYIKLPKDIAKAVVKDLIKLDSVKVETEVCKDNVNILNNSMSIKDSIIAQKDSVIALLKEKDKNCTQIVALKGEQSQKYKELSQVFEGKYKKQKTKTIVVEVVSAILLTLLVLK